MICYIKSTVKSSKRRQTSQVKYIKKIASIKFEKFSFLYQAFLNIFRESLSLYRIKIQSVFVSFLFKFCKMIIALNISGSEILRAEFLLCWNPQKSSALIYMLSCTVKTAIFLCPIQWLPRKPHFFTISIFLEVIVAEETSTREMFKFNIFFFPPYLFRIVIWLNFRWDIKTASIIKNAFIR